MDSEDSNAGDGVCSSVDDSFCTLRAAIDEANSNPGRDTIYFEDSVKIIFCNLGPLVITDSFTVIRGIDFLPVIDGSNNNYADPLFVLESKRNSLSGITIRRASGHGVVIKGSRNQIGGYPESLGSVIIENGLDIPNGAGIYISGNPANNTIIWNNIIGMESDGVSIAGNNYGILADNFSDSIDISFNLITGNHNDGVRLNNTAGYNELSGNTIGLDITETDGTGNGGSGLYIENDPGPNIIGGSGITKNIISKNKKNGIVLRNTDSTYVYNNFIGVDKIGWFEAGNEESGVVLSNGSSGNLIGEESVNSTNVISSNGRHGIHITGNGTKDNKIINNYIGVDTRGIGFLGNGFIVGQNEATGHGVLVESGASHNLIGGDSDSTRNVISANFFSGVSITGNGTDNNLVIGNYIGLSVSGNSSMPNGNGIIIRDGAKNNTIGGILDTTGNVISGNRGDIFPFGSGVLIADEGTTDNIVLGNLIGLDATGTSARRNGSSGVIIGNGASFNIIGSDNFSERNIISGNGVGDYSEGISRGVHIFGINTSHNKIIGNFIGTSFDGADPVLNIGHGIGLYSGAVNNFIGGDTPDSGNLISFNGGDGIYISGITTIGNYIRNNSIHNNDSLGITVNDNAHNSIIAPVLLSAVDTVISGFCSIPNSIIDIYKSDDDPSGFGEGELFLATTISDNSGNFTVSIPSQNEEIKVTAVTIDEFNNSSSFSNNLTVGVITSIEEEDENLPFDFSLDQNYPNPFNPVTTIRFSLAERGYTSLTIYNMLGQVIKIFYNNELSAGEYTLKWDGTDQSKKKLASGVYLMKLQQDEKMITRKIMLLK